MPELLHAAFQDASGKVTVKIFERKAGTAQHHFFDYDVDVDEDMIVIGGGAEAVEVPWGAYLTASYPNEGLTKWVASAKDHRDGNSFFFRVFAIGLKIAGLDRSDLLQNVKVFTAEGSLAHWPEAEAQVSNDYVMVGGGFNVPWRDYNPNGGNLVTASYPTSDNKWFARSKDHGTPSRSIIKCYAIGIKKNLPHVGTVQVGRTSNESSAAQHPAANCAVPPGFAITGVGAIANWQSQGSLIWKLRPTTEAVVQEALAASKDAGFAEVTSITTHALGIKIE